MTTLSLTRLTVANIKFKPLSAIFNVLLLGVGIAVILTLIHLNDQLDKRFAKDLQGIDLVVSGKGSPLQIILSNVFHIDIPTGNIPLHEAEKIKKNPMVKSAIPVALGDNYKGYRIVGTNADYIAHYKGEFAQGGFPSDEMQVVLGNEVAETQHSKIGDKIVGAHGLVNGDDLHTDNPYKVVGILKSTGTVLDRLVLTPVESVWHVHEEHNHHDGEEGRDEHHHDEDAADHRDGDHEITALLISYKSPLAAVQLPRLINSSSSMQAASPAFEVARLNKLMGTGGEILSAFGVLLISFSAFGLFITLYNAVNERKYDIALMRSLGATRGRIFGYVIAEVLALGLIGSVVGVVLAQIFLRGTAAWIYVSSHIVLEPAMIFARPEACVTILALAISIMAGLIPALKAYHTDIAKTLSRVS